MCPADTSISEEMTMTVPNLTSLVRQSDRSELPPVPVASSGI
jgi:hypothetical protein